MSTISPTFMSANTSSDIAVTVVQQPPRVCETGGLSQDMPDPTDGRAFDTLNLFCEVGLWTSNS